jgi:hypothetical protein
VTSSPRRPAPDPGLIAGVVVAAIGYVLPWFRLGRREWWYSGWGFVAEDGGGWTLWVFLLLAAALAAGVWARENQVAAALGLTALVGALLFAATVVAASLAEAGDVGGVAGIELGLGIPLMAIGFGLGIAGVVVSISAISAAEAEDAIRRRYFAGRG